jgi:ribonuclease D
MKKIGSIPALLKNILESDSILKIGRNVKKDITKLAEDYKCDLIPKGIIELGSFCKSVGYGNGRAGLSELAAAFLKQSLEKRDNIRLSNWEAESLSEEQKQYAAMD